jgi:hypothetical protein
MADAQKEDEIRIAKIAALTKVYNEIAETGKPTEEQLKFLDFMKEKPKPLDPKTITKEIGSMGGALDAIFGFVEGGGK